MKLIRFTLLSAAALALVSCGPKQEENVQGETVRNEVVKVEPLQKTEISRVVEFSTNLQGYETMSIAPSVTGKIEEIFVEVGDKVKKDQMLVRMDQMQLNTTKLTFANLTTNMERMESLYKAGSISQQNYDQTKLSYDQTKENLEFLEENTFVKARFNGVISAKNYEDGELYAGQPILVLTQIETLKAYINIPEQFFPKVKAGMKVDIVSDIYPEQTFQGTVEMIHPTIDAATHTFQAKVKIPNGKNLLRPGMYVRTSMSMGKENTIVVPYQAVLKLIGSNERYVYVNNKGVAKRVFVKMGQRFDDMIEISGEGINEGVELVTVGQAKLVDGVQLTISK
ncbi:MAG: efflux RND transporter periplasmic adaptor subunit [Bacteroidales bacterium]|jgi:RND family efflux transporter MFP subunit|nr:efflux RND transporter periplasmic adaptor subunit [Bacteroidales bacterium]MBO7321036.1 efflux RND transporter periplasmic adaptor subunit [Bacteroidales bacterium]MBO7764623.1 efflux RND transporter periplasmic adaptor subunit [Bacteroidales bacterium]MBQ2242597.1 efflux RND transporter periplasmic adaptor subunit [Bacteroidales bacterium]